MVDESGEIVTTEVSVEKSTPPQPPAPDPVTHQSSGDQGGMPDFLKSFTDKLKSTPKQNYGPSGPTNPDRRNDVGSGGSAASGAPDPANNAGPSIDSPGINTDTVDKLQSEARVWVALTDMIASRGLAMYSGDKWEQYAITDGEKTQLESALVEYFKTMPETPKLPPWVVLIVVVLMIYGGRVATAHKSRKSKKGKKKQAAGDEGQEVKKEATQAAKPQTVPPRKVEKPEVKIDPSKPYFGQARDAKFKLIINPVSVQENEARKERGGQICLNCNQNYCKPGKNACSPHCSGKLNLQKTV